MYTILYILTYLFKISKFTCRLIKINLTNIFKKKEKYHKNEFKGY